MSTATVSITLDCADLACLAEFWGKALGYHEVAAVDNFVVLGPAGEAGPRMALQQVPEPRPAKNRMHLDLWVDDIDSETARLEALGARRMQDEPFAEHGLRWYQLADPEGNEFCVANGM